MNGESRPGASADAEPLFAEWLETTPEPEAADFAAFRALHADAAKSAPRVTGASVAPALDRLWSGLQRYERLRAAIVAPARRPSIWRSRWLAAAAAALVLAAAGEVAFEITRSRALERSHRAAELAQYFADRAERLARGIDRQSATAVLTAELEEGREGAPAAKPGDPLVATPPTTAAPSVPDVKRRFAETAALLIGAGELSEQVTEHAFVRPADRETAKETALRVAALQDAPQPGAAPEVVEPSALLLARALTAADDVSFAASPLLFALRADPKFRLLTADEQARRDLSGVLLHAIAEAAKVATLDLRVVDLDADGARVDDATVWVQEAGFPDRLLGPAVRLGTSPFVGAVAPGDLRITVVDRARTRHSELRLLALPGQDLGVRVAFLRSTAEVTKGMARKAAATIDFGEATTKPRHYPAEPVRCSVAELWVDPCEVSKERWSAFQRDLELHRDDWFDGVLPVRRLPFLDAGGKVDPQIARNPVTGMTFDEAALFANWEGKRLPTEREWERVAKGSESRLYPWGKEFVDGAIDLSGSFVNAMLESIRRTGEFRFLPTPLDASRCVRVDDPAFAAGATPAGDGDPVFRLGDNVCELTEDLAVARLADGTYQYDLAESVGRVCRGGSRLFADAKTAISMQWSATIVPRISDVPDLGFRCVKTALPAFAAK